MWGGPMLCGPDPCCAEVSGEGAVLLAAGEDVDFQTHVHG